MKLGIQIDKRFQEFVREEFVRQVVECSLSTLSIGPEVEMGLLITDDETVRELNKEYRGIDETTDVLSFALTEEGADTDSPLFVTPPDGLLHLGEVIVSYPRAVRQARENNHAIEKEVALLVVHGTLHLLGHEHDEPTREQELRALQESVLSEVESDLRNGQNGEQ